MRSVLGIGRRAVHVAIVFALFLSACGGGGSDAPASVAQPATVLPVLEPVLAEVNGPGALLAAEPLGTVSAAALARQLSADGIEIAAARPRYDVQAWRLRYRTLDGAGAVVEASGLVGVPVKPAGQPSPVLSYQHGTTFKDAEAPSNHAVPGEPTLLLASLGYVAVAPDYVGYGASKGRLHPYLRAAPTAAAVVDLLTASRLWRQRVGVRGNGQLFLAGYSEGGYATVAAHRALQAAANNPHLEQLVAALPGAGPYHVTLTLDSLLDRVKDKNVLLGSLLSPGLLRYLGSSLRETVRNELIKAVVPDDADVTFETTFIDQYLADDDAALERDSNVHDWAPAAPVALFHGREDGTVPYVASTRALQTMQVRGARSVALTDCTARPADHLPCVPEWFGFMLARLAERAHDL